MSEERAKLETESMDLTRNGMLMRSRRALMKRRIKILQIALFSTFLFSSPPFLLRLIYYFVFSSLARFPLILIFIIIVVIHFSIANCAARAFRSTNY